MFEREVCEAPWKYLDSNVVDDLQRGIPPLFPWGLSIVAVNARYFNNLSTTEIRISTIAILLSSNSRLYA
jgi:hypothetical protein